jgi:hypothetical protein
MATIQEIHEQQRKNHFSFCNIDKYHEAGYEGKGINFLNLETSEHGEQVCRVFSEVAPESKVYKGRLTGKTDGTTLTHFNISVNGMTHDFETFVVENRIKLINVSKEDGRVKVKQDFIRDYIIRKHGVILTNAAGNYGEFVSGSYRDVAIVVGAVNYNNGKPIITNYSGQGDEVDFVTFPHLFTGTSFSSPFLSGMIALLLNRYGDFSQSECVEILKSLCIDLGQPCKDPKYGWGLPVLPLTEKLEILERLRGENMDFKDVEQDRWSKPAIDYCTSEGILNGFPDGTFKPTEPMTREQYAQAEYNKAKIEGRV